MIVSSTEIHDVTKVTLCDIRKLPVDEAKRFAYVRRMVVRAGDTRFTFSFFASDPKFLEIRLEDSQWCG